MIWTWPKIAFLTGWTMLLASIDWAVIDLFVRSR